MTSITHKESNYDLRYGGINPESSPPEVIGIILYFFNIREIQTQSVISVCLQSSIPRPTVLSSTAMKKNKSGK